MNKLVKGAVATAAGVALLMGGAGTFALWNTSEEVNAGTVEAGTLTIASAPPPEPGKTSRRQQQLRIIDISDWRIVPGDKLEFTQNVTINATGDNLEATLDVDEDSIKASTAGSHRWTQAADAQGPARRIDRARRAPASITPTRAGVITVSPSAAGDQHRHRQGHRRTALHRRRRRRRRQHRPEGLGRASTGLALTLKQNVALVSRGACRSRGMPHPASPAPVTKLQCSRGARREKHIHRHRAPLEHCTTDPTHPDHRRHLRNGHRARGVRRRRHLRRLEHPHHDQRLEHHLRLDGTHHQRRGQLRHPGHGQQQTASRAFYGLGPDDPEEHGIHPDLHHRRTHGIQ